MRSINFTKYILFFAGFLLIFHYTVNAQADGCIFKDTIFSISFGSERNIKEFNLNALKNYRQAYTTCPDDGYYAFVPKTSNCFLGDWITLNEDHTPNDIDGRMMLVNASEKASDFFIMNFEGFKPGTNYEFSVWLLNVCKLNSGCSPLPPNILITLETASGKRLADFRTGTLAQSDNPAWKRFYGLFTTPADLTTVKLKMTNTTNGGCGNDFAMDDINFRECYPPPPVLKPEPVIEKKTTTVVVKPVLQKTDTDQRPIKKDLQPVKKTAPADTAIIPKQVSRPGPANIAMPLPLLTRENPVIKQIETGDGEILIELYDNGEIDGDTVTIYHNNELVVSHQGLSERPISFRIRVDPSQRHHEIVMVADNLGSIPPNTSLMIITANKKRYEVFISSSEQKNAKVIIQEKE